MGSNITAERLRFDFSYADKLTPEQIQQVEQIVNAQIANDLPVTVQVMSLIKRPAPARSHSSAKSTASKSRFTRLARSRRKCAAVRMSRVPASWQIQNREQESVGKA